jgi:hypothetical protein
MSIIKHFEWTNIDDEHHMIRIIADNIDCAIEKLEKLDFEQYKQKNDIIHESNKQFTNMKKKYNIRYFYPDRLVLVDETEIFLTTTDYSVIPKNDLDKIISDMETYRDASCMFSDIMLFVNMSKNECINWIKTHECEIHEYKI